MVKYIQQLNETQRHPLRRLTSVPLPFLLLILYDLADRYVDGIVSVGNVIMFVHGRKSRFRFG